MKRKSNIAYIPTVELEDKPIKVYLQLESIKISQRQHHSRHNKILGNVKIEPSK
jgi:hypothetical protein